MFCDFCCTWYVLIVRHCNYNNNHIVGLVHEKHIIDENDGKYYKVILDGFETKYVTG